MDYMEQEPTEFGRRVKAILRKTWSSWELAHHENQRERDVSQQLHDSEGTHEAAERVA